MNQLPGDLSLFEQLYPAEQKLSVALAPFGLAFSPVAITGDVARPGIVNLPSLRPHTTVSATYAAGGIPVSDAYTGSTLWNLLQTTAGGVDMTAAKNDILDKYVIATGADGYQAAFSLGELDPKFGNQPVLAAYSDTAGQLGPTGSDGLARIVVPGDQAGGRYVSDLVDLRVGSLPEPGPSGAGGVSPQLDLTGALAHPGSFTPVSLAALNQSSSETVSFLAGAGSVTDSYTGVSLWTLIQDAGLLADPAIKNDALRFGVVATGSDGYRALVSLGEIDPAFGNQPDLVAYADSHGPLGTAGAMRLVVPGDLAGGRYVSNLTSLQVVDLTAHPS